MKLFKTARRPGDFPVGALFLAPLSLLPLGARIIETDTLHLGVCGFKQALGLPCLTCGGTRATIHLFHGEIGQAFAFQPLIVAMYLVFLIWGIISTWALASGQSLRIEFTEREDVLFKVGVVSLPLLNWIYLWQAGI